MNESEPPSINLDELRLVPDWMREGAPAPSRDYAEHRGPSDDELRGHSRGPRPPGRGGSGPEARGRRDAGTGGRGPDRPRPGSGPGPHRPPDRRDGPGSRRPDRPDRPDRPAPAAPTAPAPVQVIFQPDDRCLASIIKQIRATHLAYPLFSLARMFLQEPARHWVQFTLEPAAALAGASLFQLGDEGPVTLERATLERIAFDTLRENYYTAQTEQKEPPKGNFTSVARCRLSGTLLGPTNYHAYQPALRALFESRFSRRMSFEDYRRNIELVSDPAVVEQWKEQARTTTTIVTREGEPPTVLASVSDARAHFRQYYLDTLVRGGTVFRVHGSVARELPEAAMMQAIRRAHETEMRYPEHFVQLLRQGLQNAGLHIFKHRKRMVYVSLARPTPFGSAGSAVSPGITAILETIAALPGCTRKTLAEHVLTLQGITSAAKAKARTADMSAPVAPSVVEKTAKAESTAPALAEGSAEAPGSTTELASAVTEVAPTSDPVEASAPPAATAPASAPADDPAARAKAALAADLRFLVQAGHIIEFHDGKFDLPLPPRPKEEPPQRPAPRPEQARGSAQAGKSVPMEAAGTDTTDGSDGSDRTDASLMGSEAASDPAADFSDETAADSAESASGESRSHEPDEVVEFAGNPEAGQQPPAQGEGEPAPEIGGIEAAATATGVAPESVEVSQVAPRHEPPEAFAATEGSPEPTANPDA